jgi:hypothetical protein
MGTGLGSHAFYPPYPVEPHITLTSLLNPWRPESCSAGTRWAPGAVGAAGGNRVTALTLLTCI